jgi:hypothetical protein
MPTIDDNHFNGGINMVPGHSRPGDDLAAIIRAIITDVDHTIASADAVDLATALTLVNEIKVALNAVKTALNG